MTDFLATALWKIRLSLLITGTSSPQGISLHVIMWCSWLFGSFTVAVFVTASNAIQWSSSPEVGSVIMACAGEDVSIPWSFTTSPTETVIDVTWFLEGSDGRMTVFASYINGQFFSLPREHVQYLPNAGLRLQGATLNDTGLYSVHINSFDGSGHLTVSNRSALVQVSTPPVLSGAQFLASQSSAPVRDDVTGSWHVTLQCGPFHDLGQPPVLVEWVTPSGGVYADFHFKDGYFLLPLKSVERGTYTCSIVDQSPARACLASGSPLRGEASVDVDGEAIRLAVLEANQREAIERLQEFNSTLNRELELLRQENQILRQENKELAQEVKNVAQALSNLKGLEGLQDQLHQPGSCADVKKYNPLSGVRTLFDGNTTFSVYCDQHTDTGGWTVFQRREDGSISFFRNWTDYTSGFGDLNGEFWLGLDYLHLLTSSRKHELRVDLETFDGNKTHATYSGFTVADSSTDYALHYDHFTGGDAADSLRYHTGRPFATHDHGDQAECAIDHRGAWWYFENWSLCVANSNLNGVYKKDGAVTTENDGVFWGAFSGSYVSLKRTEMKIRPLLLG